MAAKLLGMETVPVLSIENLTAAEKKAYILADNKLAEKVPRRMRGMPRCHGWHRAAGYPRKGVFFKYALRYIGGKDRDILAIEFQELMKIDMDFDLTLTGFETPEIDIILDGAEEVDKVPVCLPSMVQTVYTTSCC